MALVAVLALSRAGWAAPLEAYGKLPSIESAVISPSGHAVAVVTTDGEQRTIVVKDLASGNLTFRGFLGEHKIRSVQWAGDGHLLLVNSAYSTAFSVVHGRREWFFGSTIDIAAKRLRPLMRNAAADLTAIFGPPLVRKRGEEISVFTQGIVFSGERGLLSLFRYNLDSGSSRLVETGSKDTIEWIVDGEGRPLAQELYDRETGRWTLKLRSGSGWREAVSEVALHDPPYLVGLGRDNESVYYVTRDEARRWVWREARADGSAPTNPLPALDDQIAIRAALDGRMIGRYALVGDEDRYSFFNAEDARAWQSILSAYPGDRVALESWSMDRRKIVVLVSSKSEGPAYALVDLAERRATWLGAQYRDLKATDISRQEPIHFKAADGLDVTGYLTLPRERAPKALPLVVFPHGGPAARDKPEFDWWAQGMASRGYAVLQVNYRGSDGLGEAILSAGYGQWGRKMQTDLSDGVRHLAAQGVIDPKRVCIVGASYGGYAALAGATHDRGVYRCSVSVGGVSDLKRMVTWSSARGGRSTLRYWTRFMGAEDANDPVLAEFSPVQHAERSEIPILLIHGKDDSVVPLEQSEAMADALRKAGKPVELVVMKGEDHWLSKGATRLETLQATVAFLEKHNPPN